MRRQTMTTPRRRRAVPFSFFSLALFLGNIFPCASASPPPPLLDRYTVSPRVSSLRDSTTQYIDPSLLPVLPDATPTCSVHLLQHDFAYTYGSPPASANYTPPVAESCGRWTRAVLDLSVSCAGEQYDRIAAVWIDGVEILRTSTAEPTESGIFWNIRKDVTRYSSVLRPSSVGERVVSMMLENIVNDVFTGIYHVNLSVHFYDLGKRSGKGEFGDLGFLTQQGSSKTPPVYSGAKVGVLFGKPADVVIPISNEKGDDGFWFRVQNEVDSHSRRIRVPNNAHRAVLEIFVSFHSDDEFWYSNPPNSYIEENHLQTNRGNGSFRQVFATIDGLFAGSVVPFPVVFTGGINPLFWAPVVSIGAFDLPSYDLELTPFLGSLLDGEFHEFGLGVTDAIAFWLLDANLHLWLDHSSSSVKAKLVRYNAPSYSITRKSESEKLNGKFKIKAKREVFVTGWLNSSLGNLTTHVEQKFKFKSSVEFRRSGNLKEVSTKSKSKTQMTVKTNENILVLQSQESEFPLWIVTLMVPGENDTYTSITNLSHVLHERSSVVLDGVSYMSTIRDEQTASGLMVVEDHSVLSGSTSTEQEYLHVDDKGCYLRSVTTKDSEIQVDKISTACAFSM